MKLGFIGTGKITSAVVTGICRSNISYKNIIISHRNKSIAKRLKKSLRKLLLVRIISKLLIQVIGYFYQ